MSLRQYQPKKCHSEISYKQYKSTSPTVIKRVQCTTSNRKRLVARLTSAPRPQLPQLAAGYTWPCSCRARATERAPEKKGLSSGNASPAPSIIAPLALTRSRTRDPTARARLLQLCALSAVRVSVYPCVCVCVRVFFPFSLTVVPF